MRDQSHRDDVERSDADPRLIAAIALGVGVFLCAAPFVVLAIYPDSGRLGRIPDLPEPPPPRLQVNPQADLKRLQASEEAELNSFGWVDRGKQIARIPIDRAMRLLAERGWPSAPAAPKRP